MKILLQKYLPWLAVIAWLSLVGVTIIQLSKVLLYRCFFLNSWPFCSASISTTDQLVQIGLLLGVVIVFAWLSYRLYQQFFVQNTMTGWSLVIWFSIIAAILVLPFSSSDFQYYFSLGQAIHQGVNPYLGDFSTYRPFFYVGADSSAYQIASGTMYSPIIVSLFALLYQLSSASLLLFTLLWKLLMVGVLVVVGFLIKQLSLAKFKSSWLAFWFLQPLILWEWVANGHFDGLWFIFVLWAIILAKRGIWWAVIITLVIAIWIKLVPVLLLPWFLLWWWQGLNKNNCLKQSVLALSGLVVGGLISILVWLPYWQGAQVFQPIILQSKWVVNSLFGFIYYGLEPFAQSLLNLSTHWWLTRFVHALLFVASLYLLWPYVKKVWLVVTKKLVWLPIDFYQAIFISLLVYIFIWQKSFWPWYAIWLLPFGWLVLQENSNQYLRKAIQWLAWAPLLLYVVNMVFGGDFWNIWFFLFNFIAVMIYPLWQIYQWRKIDYVRE